MLQKLIDNNFTRLCKDPETQKEELMNFTIAKNISRKSNNLTQK
jgi:hypothetical protein